MRIFSESPLDRRDHTNRLSCHIIHEFRFSRIDFCSAARCRQRAGESGSYDPLRAFTGISRVHSTATVARTVPLLGALRESSSPAHRLLRGYAKCQRAGKNDFYDPHGNLPHPLDRHGRAPCPRSAHRIARESSSPARRPSRGYTLPPMRPNPPSEGSAPRQRAGENDFYDPPRAFTGISRVHSIATVARTVSSLGASYCTRIFISRASAFARLRAAASAPESAVGRKRAAPACGRKRLLRPAPRLHGNLPRPLDCHGRAHRVLARRIVFHATLRLPRVGFRPATRCRQCARICRRKEARRRKRLLRPTPRFHGNLPRPLDRHGCANRALARRITRIFASRASAFARLRKVPACGRKRLLRPSR